MKVFVVSLADELERRRHVLELVKQYDFEAQFIDAVDFRKVEDKDARQHYEPTLRAIRKKRFLTKTEIGCALSHQKIYKRMIEEQIPIALVLEDDVQFLTSPSMMLESCEKLLASEGANIPYDVLILGHVKVIPEQLPFYYRKYPIKKRKQLGEYWLGTPWKQYGCGAVAYVITLEGAKKMCQSSGVITVVADDWGYYEEQHHLRVWHIRPSVAIEACERFDSTIRVERDGFLQPTWHSKLIRSTKGMIKDFLMNKVGMK